MSFRGPKHRFWGWISWWVLWLAGSPWAQAHGDLHVRIEAVTAEIQKQPRKAELYLQRGELHRHHEDWDRAEVDFDEAEKLDPGLVAVRLERSQLLLARKQFAAARKEVDRFLEARPGQVGALIVRAHALAGEKRFKEAAGEWQKVIGTTPKSNVEHYFQRARTLVAAGAEHIDEALETLDAGMVRIGNVPSLSLYAVELEVGRKRYDAALERLGRAMPPSGRKESWREMRGDILARAGRKEEAKAEYTRALEELKASPQRARGTKAGMELEARLRTKAKK